MKKIVVLLIGLVSTLAFADITMTFDDNSDLNGWYKDRYDPAVFETAEFDGDSRLHIGIAPPAQASSFYNYQGKKFDTNLSGSVMKFSIDLYLDSTWTDVNTGMWATGRDVNGDISAYPILAYRDSDTVNAGFYAFDYTNGGWIMETSVTAMDQWYNMEFVMTVGSGVEYFINGSSIGFFADSDTTSLDNVIINTYNYDNEYDVYYDNFTATAVPAPGAILLTGLGTAIVGRIRRRF